MADRDASRDLPGQTIDACSSKRLGMHSCLELVKVMNCLEILVMLQLSNDVSSESLTLLVHLKYLCILHAIICLDLFLSTSISNRFKGSLNSRPNHHDHSEL